MKEIRFVSSTVRPGAGNADAAGVAGIARRPNEPSTRIHRDRVDYRNILLVVHAARRSFV